ncbi:MAG: hypothetical protein ACOVKJ_04160, partial [Flavobacterium sp.]
MNKKEIFISVFQMAESGELTNLEQKDIMNALFSYGCSLKPDEVNEEFKKIRVGLRHLLEQSEKCTDSALNSVEEFHKAVRDVIGKEKSLPSGATIGDDAETIAFISSLVKDAYNFSQAEKVIGIARQTIKTHSEKGLHTFKTKSIKSNDYIT